MYRLLATSSVLAFLVTLSCLDPYDHPGDQTNSNLLVVDGFLNSTNQTARIKLSRTVTLDDDVAFPPETGATVKVESSNGGQIDLFEISSGIYEVAGLNFSAPPYRVFIRCKDGKEYRSDLIALTTSPPIDSVTWRPRPEGVDIFVNTHDEKGASRFYQWSLMETWEYTAKFLSLFNFVNGEAILRAPDELIYKCWKTENSTNIIVGSTNQLNDDVVKDFQIAFHARGSQKVSRRYRLAVQQKVLTEEAYNYWQQLAKTTENLGGLFDPLPSRISGNVHNTQNFAEPVLGFISGGEVQEKVIFINFYDLPDYLLFIPPSPCRLDTILTRDLPHQAPTTILGQGFGSPVTLGYTTSAADCLDCRREGGSLTPPPFWN